MDSAFYYTFSTIAQALAAMITLLGAFVLYRAQLLGGELDQAAGLIRTHGKVDASARAEMDAAHITGNHKKVFDIARISQQGPESSDFRASLAKFEEVDRNRKSLLSSFALAMVVSIAVIGGSVVVLAYTPSLAVHCRASYYLVGGYVAFCICLVLYARLLLKQLPWAKT